MGPRIDPEKREFIVQYHASKEPEPTEHGEQSEEPDEEPECDEAGEGERTCACRFCSGEMRMTGSTERPRVSELMEMPLCSLSPRSGGHAGHTRCQAARDPGPTGPARTTPRLRS